MKTIVTHPNFDYMQEEFLKDSNIRICPKQWEYFGDKEPNFRIQEENGEIEYQDVTYIGDFSHSSKTFENYAAIRAILDGVPNKVRVIIPYYPVGTMERAEKKGEAVTAKYLADILSSLPSGRDMKTSIHHLDLHNPVIKHYYDASKVNPELHTAMTLIKEVISTETNIIFPDEGAYKRFRRYFEGYNVIVCEKRKENGIKTVRVKEGVAIGDHGIVIDDLGLSGGTLMECSGATRAIGIKKCDAYVTHGSFPNESHEKIVEEFDTLYTTDSIPQNITRAKDIPNMEVLRIAGLIKKIISK